MLLSKFGVLLPHVFRAGKQLLDFRTSGFFVFPVFPYFRFSVLPVSSVLPVLDARPDLEASEIPHSGGKEIP